MRVTCIPETTSSASAASNTSGLTRSAPRSIAAYERCIAVNIRRFLGFDRRIR